MINFETLIKALPYISEAVKDIPAVENLFQEMLRGFHSEDQDALKAMLASDEIAVEAAHEEVQTKLTKAEKK